MVCQFIKLPGGGRAIVCSRSRRPPRRKCGCGETAGLQCDFPLRPGKTCDAHLCERCAIEVGPDQHHCPTHDQVAAAPVRQMSFL